MIPCRKKLGFCAPVGQRWQLGLERMNEKDKVMRRKEALFAVIGGIVGAVLVMATGSFSPLGAQD